MNDARDEIDFVPVGYRCAMVLTAITKRILSKDALTHGQRLELLEKLHSLTDLYFTLDVLAAIEPASDVEAQIFCEAGSLDSGEDRRSFASYELLGRTEVFRLFRSVIPAIKLKETQWRKVQELPCSVLPARH